MQWAAGNCARNSEQFEERAAAPMPSNAVRRMGTTSRASGSRRRWRSTTRRWTAQPTRASAPSTTRCPAGRWHSAATSRYLDLHEHGHETDLLSRNASTTTATMQRAAVPGNHQEGRASPGPGDRQPPQDRAHHGEGKEETGLSPGRASWSWILEHPDAKAQDTLVPPSKIGSDRGTRPRVPAVPVLPPP